MSGEVNNQRIGLRALYSLEEQQEQQPEKLPTVRRGLVGLGQSNVDGQTITLERRLNLVGDDGKPVSKEQLRERLQQGLAAAVQLGEEQAHSAQLALDLEAMSEAKRIASGVGKAIADGNLPVSRHEPAVIPEARLMIPEELTQLLGTSLAHRALEKRVKALLDPVLLERGLSISFANGQGRIELTQGRPPPSADQKVKEAFGLGLSQGAHRQVEIEALGQQIGAAVLTQLVLQAKVAEASGLSLLGNDGPGGRPTRGQPVEVPIKWDIKSFGDAAAQLFAGLTGPEVTRLWGEVTSILRQGIKDTPSLAQLPLPLLRCAENSVTFGVPFRPAMAAEARSSLL